MRGSRGYRYIRQRLRKREDPMHIYGKKVRELMAEEGYIITYTPEEARFQYEYKGEIGDAPGNLVARDFRADANRLWLTDVTQFRIPAGKAYLIPVIDCFDGMTVAWTMRTARRRDGQHDARGGVRNVRAGRGPRDPQRPGVPLQVARTFEICERHGLERSMSRKGCSPDNSAMEGFFGQLKNNEFFYGRDSRESWRRPGGFHIPARRLHEILPRCERIKRSLGWMSPSQYRKSWAWPPSVSSKWGAPPSLTTGFHKSEFSDKSHFLWKYDTEQLVEPPRCRRMRRH